MLGLLYHELFLLFKVWHCFISGHNNVLLFVSLKLYFCVMTLFYT
jgi:hypothetical protein